MILRYQIILLGKVVSYFNSAFVNESEFATIQLIKNFNYLNSKCTILFYPKRYLNSYPLCFIEKKTCLK